MMFYSQNYIQGKNGVIMCVDSQELIMEDISQNEMKSPKWFRSWEFNQFGIQISQTHI